MYQYNNKRTNYLYAILSISSDPVFPRNMIDLKIFKYIIIYQNLHKRIILKQRATPILNFQIAKFEIEDVFRITLGQYL